MAKFADEMTCPSVTSTPDNFRVPVAGKVAIVTLLSAVPSGSVYALVKSEAVNVRVVSSVPDLLNALMVGASFTGVTFTVDVIVFEFNALSLTV